MRSLIPILILACTTAHGALVTNLVVKAADLTSSRLASRQIWLTPTDENTSGEFLISRETVKQNADTNGVATFTNVVNGYYTLRLASSPPSYFYLAITNGDAASVNATNYLTSSQSANGLAQSWTKSQSDGRYIRGVVAGTNVTTRTNGGYVTVNAEAVGDAAQWATNPATAMVNMDDNSISNLAAINMNAGTIFMEGGGTLDTDGGTVLAYQVTSTGFSGDGSGLLSLPSSQLVGQIPLGNLSNIGTNDMSAAAHALYIASGAGGSATNWAEYPATTNVDFATYNAENVGTQTVARLVVTSGLIGDGASLTNLASFKVLNVQHYGATGDGTTDDTDAIQACLDAGTNAYIYFPAGTYRVGKTAQTNIQEGKHSLTILSGRHLIGETRDGVVIKPLDDAGNNMPILFTPTNQVGDISIERLTIHGNNGRAAVVNAGAEDEGINFKSGTSLIMRELFISNCGQDAIDVDSGSSILIERCIITNNWGCGVHFVGSGSSFVTIRDNRFYTNGWVRAAGGGLNGTRVGNIGIDNAATSLIVGNYAENGGAHNMVMSVNAINTWVVGNWFLQPAASRTIWATNTVYSSTNLYLYGSAQCVIENNRIQGGAVGSIGIIHLGATNYGPSTIRDNKFTALSYGIRDYYGTGLRVSGNYINCFSSGVEINEGVGYSITDNYIVSDSTGDNCIEITSGVGAGCLVMGNTISTGRLRINAGSVKVIVKNNVLINSATLYLWNSSGSTFTGNTGPLLAFYGAGTQGTFSHNDFDSVLYFNGVPDYTDSTWYLNFGVTSTNNIAP